MNVAAEVDDPGSVLAYYRRAVALRQAMPALRRGAFEGFDLEHPQVFASQGALPVHAAGRGNAIGGEAGGNEFFVVLNLTDTPAVYPVPYPVPPAVARVYRLV